MTSECDVLHTVAYRKQSHPPVLLMLPYSTPSVTASNSYILTNPRRHSIFLTVRATKNLFTRTRTQDRFQWLYSLFLFVPTEIRNSVLGDVLSCLVSELQNHIYRASNPGAVFAEISVTVFPGIEL